MLAKLTKERVSVFRDQLAMAAMTAGIHDLASNNPPTDDEFDEYARSCYRLADAMLRVREEVSHGSNSA
jgi:hypothetical protein